MDARYTPEDGDIVIREEKRNGVRLYIVLRASDADPASPPEPSARNPDQASVQPVREEAVAEALKSAESLRVRVWLADGQDDFTLIEDFRVD